MVWYKVGAADEKPGQSGIAHFLEHLMFKGTKRRTLTGNSPRSSRRLARRGKRLHVTQDYTAYFQRVAKQHLKTMMELGSRPHGQSRIAQGSGKDLSFKVILEERDFSRWTP